MIVPRHWAEARLQHREPRRQVTIKRFGWSDESQEAAQAMANERAAEAMKLVLAGQKLKRFEPKVAYNGAEGVPIREEIVGIHGDTIITRNAYGARCLNTPNVLFADVDFKKSETGCGYLIAFFAWSIASFIADAWIHPAWLRFATIPAAPIVGGLVLGRVWLWRQRHNTVNEKQKALERIEQFSNDNPTWSFRLYRTPNGYRILVTHRPFSPTDSEVLSFFAAIGTDSIYQRMCQNQQCFRARVSPKPWRIGIKEHVKPISGAWPIAPEKVPLRNAWVERYEAAAKDYAACEYISSYGYATVHSTVRSVLALHDSLSGAESGKPIA